ncbi:MAG: GntR family transcriptional regulator [Candidimonas sp.]|nr:MAG: GntR family transcriptional regulator [Candidimonas sp.]TAM22764.1 MAG: GntR family transcriptional regulator [Candidimonas sp.]
MEAPLCLPFDPAPAQPRHRLPLGATDCHCHVFMDTSHYPMLRERSYTPAPAALEQYVRMCEIVGLARTVQVSASVYGFDNSLTLDVIRILGKHRARGVAAVRPGTGRQELRGLYEAGMRGVRLSTTVKGYGGTELMQQLAAAVSPFGMHLQLHLRKVAELADLEPELMCTPAPLVFDHMGGVLGAEGVDCAGFQALLRILRARDDCWVKISSWYRRSDSGGPDFADMAPIVQALVETRADRLLFGTNWPHPALFASQADRVPNDGHLVDQFCDWVPDERVRELILVANPSRLYGFEDL